MKLFGNSKHKIDDNKEEINSPESVSSCEDEFDLSRFGIFEESEESAPVPTDETPELDTEEYSDAKAASGRQYELNFQYSEPAFLDSIEEKPVDKKPLLSGKAKGILLLAASAAVFLLVAFVIYLKLTTGGVSV